MGQEHARVFQRFAPTKVLLSLLHHPMLGQCCTVNSGWSGWCFGFFLLVVFHASSTIRSALSQRCSRVQLRVDSEEKANSRSPVGLTHNRWMALVGLSHCGKRTQAATDFGHSSRRHFHIEAIPRLFLQPQASLTVYRKCFHAHITHTANVADAYRQLLLDSRQLIV